MQDVGRRKLEAGRFLSGRGYHVLAACLCAQYVVRFTASNWSPAALQGLKKFLKKERLHHCIGVIKACLQGEAPPWQAGGIAACASVFQREDHVWMDLLSTLPAQP